jgi:hypothetical protein
MTHHADAYLASSQQWEREWVEFAARCEAIAAGTGGPEWANCGTGGRAAH